MPTKKELFTSKIGQTSLSPMSFEVGHAKGVTIYDTDGNAFYDMNSGISVSSIGHCHPRVIAAVEKQVSSYMHTMVYGEHVQRPQVDFAEALLDQIDDRLNNIYMLMAGTEAIELSIKLGRKFTGRYEIIACSNAYHGSTHGSESLRSDLKYTRRFKPLVPGIRHMEFNQIEQLSKITSRTAAVIMEVVQAEAGIIVPDQEYLNALRDQCDQHGVLLVFDEIQTGFGRTGRMFAHQHFDIVPDILAIGKAMGGGMPLAGVVCGQDVMRSISANPALGHITTFGGHPVSCAAALASLQVIIEENLIEQVDAKAKWFQQNLSHELIHEIRGLGLMMAVQLKSEDLLMPMVEKAQKNGVFIDWFLFNDASFRLAPPLTISKQEIQDVCIRLKNALDELL